MHQKEQYNTFEEFRVLPALLRGAVIVAEDVPLREVVHIIGMLYRLN
jgi:hypothetical protein